MDNNYIIKNAYTNLDKLLKKNEEKLKSISKYISISNGTDLERPVMEFRDKNNNKLFSAEYELLSIEYYLNNETIWIWSWAHPQIEKNKTLICRELLSYGLDLINNENDEFGLLTKNLLTNSRIRVNLVETELIVALSLYLSKKEIIISLDDNYDGLKSKGWIIITKFLD